MNLLFIISISTNFVREFMRPPLVFDVLISSEEAHLEKIVSSIINLN